MLEARKAAIAAYNQELASVSPEVLSEAASKDSKSHLKDAKFSAIMDTPAQTAAHLALAGASPRIGRRILATAYSNESRIISETLRTAREQESDDVVALHRKDLIETRRKAKLLRGGRIF
jgi:hypothetical protein